MKAKHIILGAGITGLSIALKLRELGYSVLIIEKENSYGGHARSIQMGKLFLDYGPHIFRSNNTKALDFIRNLSDMREITSNPKAYKYGLLFDHVVPNISLNTIENLERITGKRFPRSELKNFDECIGDNFQDKLVEVLGYDLYWELFGEYSEKWWGVNPKELDANIIPKVKFSSEASYGHVTVKEGFRKELYPRYGGFYSIPNKIMQILNKLKDVEILYNHEVVGMETKENNISQIIVRDSNDMIKEIKIEGNVYCTVPLDNVAKWLGLNSSIDYRGLLFGFFLFKGRTKFDNFSWIYIHEKRLLAGRVYDARYYNQGVNSDITAICLEVPSNPGDGKWENPEKICKRAFEELIGEGLINATSLTPLEFKYTKMRHAYPLFKIGFKEQAKMLIKHITDQYKNLFIEGRAGRFEYLNTNNLIEQYLFSDYLQKTLNNSYIT